MINYTCNKETARKLKECIDDHDRILKRIFDDHWKIFWINNKQKFPRELQNSIEEAVQKMLNCGDPESGYALYRCTSCGKGRIKVGFTCKSRFCPSCGKVYVDSWVEKTLKSIANVRHRHIMFSIPEEFRQLFYWNREFLKDLADMAAETIIEVLSTQHKRRGGKRKVFPGVIDVIHTFGRDMKFNPHVHALVAEKAIDKARGKWKDFSFMLYKGFRKVWQYKLLNFIKKKFKKNARVVRQVEECWNKKSNGLYVHLKEPMKSARHAARYLGRYLGRPVIAQYRIVKYDGENVTFWYDDHKSGQRKYMTLQAERFIGRLVMHIPVKSFQMVRRYGFYGRHVSEAIKAMVEATRRMVQQIFEFIKGEKKSWRMRLIESFQRDPLKCPYCGEEMELWEIWHPKYGLIYDFCRDAPTYVPEEKEEKTTQTATDKIVQILFPFMRSPEGSF